MRALALSLLLVLTSGAALAADRPLGDFFGTFQGAALGQTADSAFFAVKVRDLDVTIKAAPSGGFTLAWTAVIRDGADSKPGDVRKRTDEMAFVPTATAKLYHVTGHDDPLKQHGYGWARIAGQTLTVTILSHDGNGAYSLQSYDRTLTAKGMELVFRRVEDGARVRTIRGTLTREKS